MNRNPGKIEDDEVIRNRLKVDTDRKKAGATFVSTSQQDSGMQRKSGGIGLS